MGANPVSLYAPVASEVVVGGKAVTAVFGPVLGGAILNPAMAEDQGIAIVEPLYVDITGADATVGETATSVPIQPGGAFTIPNQTTSVSVNAATSGHKFSAYVLQPQTPYPPTPQPGTFPPAGPTTLTALIPSYLYVQYADDDNLQAFVASWNALAQSYVTWFATIGLPVYTGAQIVGSLLDWVAEGLYGFVRPALSSGRNRNIGPYNTFAFNTHAFNATKVVGPSNVTATSDDVFKRIITWNFYKGDGNVFNVRWLKRRIMRFLYGPQGTAPNIDQTYIVDVSFGSDGVVAIRLGGGSRTILGGALFNRFGYNRMAFNHLVTQFNSGPNPPALASVLKEGIDSGVLALPFQATFIVAV
jgi:hypothetical protein